MISFLQLCFLVFLAVSGGVVVGASFVALLVIFDLIPRLAQLSNAYRKSIWFESALICGAMYFTIADIFNWKLPFNNQLLLIVIGLFVGMFVGMLAAALTEVINVLPILAKRLKLGDALIGLMMAMVIGKTIGSLFDWLIFQK